MTDTQTHASIQREQLVELLRQRGVNDAAGLLDRFGAARVLAAIQEWDGRDSVGPGLLIKLVTKGVPARRRPQEPGPISAQGVRDRLEWFARTIERFPPGALIEPHDALRARYWPSTAECDGDMLALASDPPVLEARCDVCGFRIGYGLAAVPENGRAS